VPRGGSEAKGAFVMGTVDVNVAEMSTGEAGFVVEPMSPIYWEVKFPIEPCFRRVHDGFLSSIQWKGKC
jgi:hypothetical protein